VKEKITAFVDGLIIYDYILFGGSFALFILLIILGIIVRKKISLAIFLILLAFSLLIIAPTIGYIQMHQYLFKNTTTLVSQKKLEFTQAIVIRGNIKNESKFNFKTCKITAKVHKVSKNKYKNYLLKFKTIAKASITKENIQKQEVRDFKLFVEPFTYAKDYNITVGARCK
jgi:hypothetical protein